MKRNIAIAAVTAAALIAGGTATALAVTGDDGSATGQTGARLSDDGVRDDDSGRDDDARVASVAVTASDAITAALQQSPGTAVSAELDDEDDGGKAAWNVGILTGGDTWHSVRVDPGTGRVLGSHSGQEDDTAQARAALKGTSVTAAEAAEAAAGKGTVTSVDLDDDGRPKAWEVETHSSGKADHDWRVDLATGKVTADRSDRSDDSDDSDDSEDSDDAADD